MWLSGPKCGLVATSGVKPNGSDGRPDLRRRQEGDTCRILTRLFGGAAHRVSDARAARFLLLIKGRQGGRSFIANESGFLLSVIYVSELLRVCPVYGLDGVY